MRFLPAAIFWGGIGFVAFRIAFYVTLSGQKRWGQKVSWPIATAYVGAGVFLAWGVAALNQFYKGMPLMLPASKTVLAISPIGWFVLFFVMGALVVLKDQVWRWRHANVVCALVLVLLLWAVSGAALYPMFFGPNSWIS